MGGINLGGTEMVTDFGSNEGALHDGRCLCGREQGRGLAAEETSAPGRLAALPPGIANRGPRLDCPVPSRLPGV